MKGPRLISNVGDVGISDAVRPTRNAFCNRSMGKSAFKTLCNQYVRRRSGFPMPTFRDHRTQVSEP